MNPAPPVIIIFLTSGNGSYFVLPVKTGASFQTPKSSKNLFAEAGAVQLLMSTSHPTVWATLRPNVPAPFAAMMKNWRWTERLCRMRRKLFRYRA